MLEKNFQLEIDVMDQTPQHMGRLVKTDFGGNILNLRLTKNGKIYDLSEANTVTFVVRYNNEYLSMINGTIIDATNGHVSLDMPDVCVSYTGLYEMEVQIKVAGTQVTSAIFMYDVRGDLTDGADPSLDPEYPILVQLINDVEQLESNITAAESDRVTAENTRESNETTRQSNESTRQSQETTRVNQESSRVTAESNRVTAENNRELAETTRENQETTRQSNESNRISNEDNRQANETIREQFIFAGNYNSSIQYLKNNTVLFEGSSYVALQDTLGNAPTNATYWQPVAIGGESIGDMSKVVYDPNNVDGDIFDMENMVEGTTKKILTQQERDNIENNKNQITDVTNSKVYDYEIKVIDGKPFIEYSEVL
ncbi:MAG: BppU family phage baseplate upper protein [Clostridiales bacterium]|nr:BppU family phage baseplate upper protein [Clostridiales bacterium]